MDNASLTLNLVRREYTLNADQFSNLAEEFFGHSMESTLSGGMNEGEPEADAEVCFEFTNLSDKREFFRAVNCFKASSASR